MWRRRVVTHRQFLSLVVSLVVAAALALELLAAEGNGLSGAGGPALAVARVAGLLAAALLLVLVVLAARLPVLERLVGQEELLCVHRQLGPFPLPLLVVHVVAVSIGYAEIDATGAPRQFWTLLADFPDVLAAFAGFVLIGVATIASWRVSRRHLHHETWWAIHLYLYLALALAFAHQLANGASFVHHQIAAISWAALWALTAGVVLVYRVGLPLVRNLRHRLRVVAVEPAGTGAISIFCEGRDLAQLPARGGQFLLWRFLARGLWWQAHPYSISALPTGDRLRITLRTDGDFGRALSRLAPGVRVVVEGPYGAFTTEHLRRPAVLLVGAGIGVTPLRSLLEELPRGLDVHVVTRASTSAALPLREELVELVAARGGQLLELTGSREEVAPRLHELGHLVPRLSERDVYICGPAGFRDQVIVALREQGVPDGAIHFEDFRF